MVTFGKPSDGDDVPAREVARPKLIELADRLRLNDPHDVLDGTELMALADDITANEEPVMLAALLARLPQFTAGQTRLAYAERILAEVNDA